MNASNAPMNPLARQFAGYIFDFLRFCRAHHSAATVSLAKHYPSRTELQHSDQRREALRWLFRAGRDGDARVMLPQQRAEAPEARAGNENPRASMVRANEPPLAVRDLGGADWERDLIVALRRKGLLWRTEQAYRQWAARFAAHLRPRSPYAAEGADVAAFLSKLAVEGRAGASTQKQALNAIVFLMEEALRRSVGEIEFARAWARRRVPTVLTKSECDRLFAELPGTMKLMARLM